MNEFCEEYSAKLDNFILANVAPDCLLLREIGCFVNKSIEELELLKREKRFPSKERAEKYYVSVYKLSLMLKKCIDSSIKYVDIGEIVWVNAFLDNLDLALLLNKKGYKEGSICTERQININGELITDYQYEPYESEYAEYHQTEFKNFQRLKDRFGKTRKNANENVENERKLINIKPSKMFFTIFTVCCLLSVAALFTLVAIGRSNKLLLYILATILAIANIVGLASRIIGQVLAGKEKAREREIKIKNHFDEN